MCFKVYLHFFVQWRLQSVIEKIQPCHISPTLNSLDFWFKPSRHHHYCSCHAYKTVSHEQPHSVDNEDVVWHLWEQLHWSLIASSWLILKAQFLRKRAPVVASPMENLSFQTKLRLHRFKPLMGGIFPAVILPSQSGGFSFIVLSLKNLQSLPNFGMWNLITPLSKETAKIFYLSPYWSLLFSCVLPL